MAMLDAIRPWFQIVWGSLFLVPLVLRRESFWFGLPMARRTHPVRFWVALVVGTLLVGNGVRDLIVPA